MLYFTDFNFLYLHFVKTTCQHFYLNMFGAKYNTNCICFLEHLFMIRSELIEGQCRKGLIIFTGVIYNVTYIQVSTEEVQNLFHFMNLSAASAVVTIPTLMISRRKILYMYSMDVETSLILIYCYSISLEQLDVNIPIVQKSVTHNCTDKSSLFLYTDLQLCLYLRKNLPLKQ